MRLSRIRYLIAMYFKASGNYPIPPGKLALIIMKMASDYSYKYPEYEKYLLYSLDKGRFKWYNTSLNKHLDRLMDEGFLIRESDSFHSYPRCKLDPNIPYIPIQDQWNPIITEARTMAKLYQKTKCYRNWLGGQRIHVYYRKDKT